MSGPTLLHRSDFPGGLHLEYHKDLVAGAPIATAPVPPELVIPLAQHVGTPADPVVQVGQHVKRGEVIGRAHGYISLPVHAASSGTVTAIEERPVAHPSGIPARCVVIDTDGEDAAAEPEWETIADPEAAEPHVLRDIARAAGIAGLGGASFPAFVKLNPAKPVDALIINGAECEPYIACDQALMAEDADQIVAGIRIMLRALDAPECLIGIEDNKPRAIAALTEAAASDARITVVTVPTRYPQGGEKQLIQTLTGREVPSQGLPLDIGIVCQNPGTARAFYRAVVHGEPLIDRVISLTGLAMAQPRNVRARIGTPLGWLAAQFGGFSETPGRLVMGGPMMGIRIPDDGGVPLVKASNCLLAMRAEDVRPPEPAMPCIRCGACADVCPAKLLPQQLYWHAKAREFDKAQRYNLFDCIECGACAAVCPSHIPLVQYYRFAKTEIWAEERERLAADAARVRHEERQRRMEREAAEKEAARAARKKKASGGSAADDDPIARAKTAAAERRKAKDEGEQSAPQADDPVARAKAAAAARKQQKAETEAEPLSSDNAQPAEADENDPVARAKAAAQARKAAQAEATTSSDSAPETSSDSEEDPVEKAKAAARARKAARKAAAEDSTGDAATDPVEKAKAAARARKAAQSEGTTSSEAAPEAGGDSEDPVEKAKAAARARKAAREASAQDSAGNADSDPVEKAKAAARARKAAQAEGATSSDAAPAASDGNEDPVEKAKAAARARKAQKQAAEATPAPAPEGGDDTPAEDDSVARAIAAAKAKKAARKADDEGGEA
ncbi:electron transport complex subunit RsxC [Algiphilus aromaticivorans]|uniref:electron transport complex subunit RsxC n=1 Tax=Algiphilus aromaticivorans TaxID=382454 RepID=UPI000693F482|nr:electron transport complex subunit RsxC [Algiphilus aromaticivorans]